MACPARADRSLESISGGINRESESSSEVDAASAARFVPQLLQNLVPAGEMVAHSEHDTASAFPQLAQNFAVDAFSCLQAGQCTAPSHGIDMRHATCSNPRKSSDAAIFVARTGRRDLIRQIGRPEERHPAIVWIQAVSHFDGIVTITSSGRGLSAI
jgi:hypothetical protein